MNSQRGRRPERLGKVLKESVRALGWERRLSEEEVISRWDEAVGPHIAAHARPSSVLNGRLTVVTASPVWAQQLALLKSDLLRRIARRFGPNLVTDLYFVAGTIDSSPAPAAPAPDAAEPREIPPELAAEIDVIADEEVRECVRRLCRASLTRPRPGGGSP